MAYKKKSKMSTKILFFIVGGILIAGAGYFFGKNSSQSLKDSHTVGSFVSEKTDSLIANKNDVKISNSDVVKEWEGLSNSDLYDYASQENIYLAPDFRVVLREAVDLTGDDLAEGVFEGNGGNSGVAFILVKGIDGESFVAKQKDREGVVYPAQLLSVGRSMVQETYELLPFENGFYTASLSFDDALGEFICIADGVNAYSWNSYIQLFEWNSELTLEYSGDVCR